MLTKKQKYIIAALFFGIGIFIVLIKKRKKKMIIVEGSYKVASGNCDHLHAFQSTSGKIIGGMNDKIFVKLKEMYDNGINPKVTSVDVVMNAKEWKVDWKVTIEPSDDGKAWLGFTSRGSSGSTAWTRANTGSQSFETVKSKISDQVNEPNINQAGQEHPIN